MPIKIITVITELPDRKCSVEGRIQNLGAPTERESRMLRKFLDHGTTDGCGFRLEVGSESYPLDEGRV